MDTEINEQMRAYWKKASKKHYELHREEILQKRRERAYIKQLEKLKTTTK